MEGICFSIIKAIYDKPIVNIIVYGENLKPFPMRQWCPLSPVSFNIILEFLAKAMKQKKEIKAIQIGKKEGRSSLFLDDKIL
jgi:hypothetical protein